jgi:catechol 2,3-dioxygenase-like lactoylglutathione lyase family enzyme
VPIELNTVLYPVKDVDQAKATFTALFGVEPHVDSKYYVGYEVDGHEIGLVPNGHDQGMAGPEAYFDVEDINASLAALKAGLLVAKVRDSDGNLIGVKQPPASA